MPPAKKHVSTIKPSSHHRRDDVVGCFIGTSCHKGCKATNDAGGDGNDYRSRESISGIESDIVLFEQVVLDG